MHLAPRQGAAKGLPWGEFRFRCARAGSILGGSARRTCCSLRWTGSDAVTGREPRSVPTDELSKGESR